MTSGPVDTRPLGRSPLQVARLGVGTMTWGSPSGLARFTPASCPTRSRRSGRGVPCVRGQHGRGSDLFDTAHVQQRASEARWASWPRDHRVLATKFPPGPQRTDDLPAALEAPART